LDQHVEDLAILWNTRVVSVNAGAVALRHLARLDARLVAHLDGCLIAGTEGFRRLMARMEDPASSSVFAATAAALESRDAAAAEQCFTITESVPMTAKGAVSALGWVDRDRLVGVGRALLASATLLRRRLGFAACRLQGADPGELLTKAFQEELPQVRSEALR